MFDFLNRFRNPVAGEIEETSDPVPAGLAQPQNKFVPKKDQKRIASLLYQEYGCSPVLLSSAGIYLKSKGVSHFDFGFSRLKQLLENCDKYLAVKDDAHKGQPTVAVLEGSLNRSVSAKDATSSTEEGQDLIGEIVFIGKNSFGKDYAIVKASSGSTYLLHDWGVENPYGVSDLNINETIRFDLSTNENGRTYATQARVYKTNSNVKPVKKSIIESDKNNDESKRQNDIPIAVQQRLYRLLTKEFGFDREQIPLAEFGLFLNKIFFDYTSFGFEKAKPFALALDEILEVSYAEAGGVIHPYFSLKHKSEWDDVSPAVVISDSISTTAPMVLRDLSRSDGAKAYDTEESVQDKLALKAFSNITPWEDTLESLAKHALTETWGFSVEKPYEILDSYLVYTFYRLKTEKKVLVSADRKFAAFNTGLIDELYDDVFACFKANQNENNSWAFEGFSTERGSDRTAECLRSFRPLPEPPSYFTHLKDILYDPRIEIRARIKHILFENLDRFPVAFLESCLHSSEEAMGYVKQLKSLTGGELDDDKTDHLLNNLRAYIKSNPSCLRNLVRRIESAREAAAAQAKSNYKVAVPIYYPPCNSMSFLLPLDLTDDGNPDIALVIQREESDQVYTGRTVLTLEMAYNDARLVCKQENDWLVKWMSG